MKCLIKNASVVNEGVTFKADVLLEDGFISAISRSCNLSAEDARVIDAEGKYLIPGLIDEHVHFREPGLTAKADIASESRAAVAGGVTSFMDMPNTAPQTTTRQLLEEKFALAAQKSIANYSFYIGATNDNLRETTGINPDNVCGIKLFMGSSTGNMLVDNGQALEDLFREAPCLIAAHCEDESIIKANTETYRAMAENGQIVPDASIHPLIRTSEACYRSSELAVDLARKTGARLHIMHISTAEELNLLRNDIPLAEKRITAETCPHYLLLDQSRYKDLGYLIKCNPAVKSANDRSALLNAIASGLIDTIGTDHAPHLKEEKLTGNCFTSKSGFPSIQHSLQLMSTVQGLAIEKIVQLMCHNPAILYRIDRRGFIREGYHADLAVVDQNCPGIISDATEYSKCGWTPYQGFSVSTKVTHTFVNGRLVFENGVFHDSPAGERLSFNRQ